MMFIIVAVFIASASAQTCSNSQGPCLSTKVNTLDIFFCPEGMSCLNNATCCAYADIVVSTTTTTTTVAPATTCVDKINPSTGVSDCPKNANLCNDQVYYTLMTDQCPKTCNRCGGSNPGGGTTTTCVDKVNPSTGISECGPKAYLCTNALYKSLMQDQCPKTCGFC